MFSLIQKLLLSRPLEAAATPSKAQIAGILDGRLAVVEQILATTKQPAVSIGVIHQGSRVFGDNYGRIDIESGQKPTAETIYCIVSLTKAFIVAAIDLLARRGSLQWDTSIASLIPDYARLDDDPMLARMTLRDICSHPTGLLGLAELIHGMDGRILSPKSHVIDIANALPKRKSFRDSYLYNNTIVHDTDDNIAKAYMPLADQSLPEIAPTELSADSMNGGSGGLRSSVNDMLAWCSSLLKSFNCPTKDLASPAFDRATMAKSRSVQDGDYCAGWYYQQTPS